MINYDNFTKRMESEEGKAQLNSIVEMYKQRKKRVKQLMENTQYIEWLEEFTKKHPSFSSNEWLYNKDEISNDDNEKVDMLEMFFDGIKEYADANYIYGIPCDFGEYYLLKYKDNIYKIGCLVGQGTLFFCDLFEDASGAKYICFEDILNPNPRIAVKTALITNQLERIDDLLDELYGKGIPENAITSRVNNYLDKKRNELKSK